MNVCVWLCLAASVPGMVHSDALQGLKQRTATQEIKETGAWNEILPINQHDNDITLPELLGHSKKTVVRRQAESCSSHSGNTTFIEPAGCKYAGEALTLCQPGEVKIARCIKDKSKVCNPCTVGETFMPSPNDCIRCLPCPPCGIDEQIIVECTLTSERQCEPISPTTSTVGKTTQPSTAEVVGTTTGSSDGSIASSESMVDILVATSTPGPSTVIAGGSEYIMLPKLVFFVVIGVLAVAIIITLLFLFCGCCRYRRMKNENSKLKVQLQENGIHNVEIKGTSNGRSTKQGYTKIPSDDIEMMAARSNQKIEKKNSNQNGNSSQLQLADKNIDNIVEIGGDDLEPPYAQVDKHGGSEPKPSDNQHQSTPVKMAAAGSAPDMDPVAIPVFTEAEEEKQELATVAVVEEPPYDRADLPFDRAESPYDRADVPKVKADPPYDSANVPSSRADPPYDSANVPFDRSEADTRSQSFKGRIGSTSSDDPPPLPERNNALQRSNTTGSSLIRQSTNIRKDRSGLDRSHRNNTGLEGQPSLPQSPDTVSKKKSGLRRFFPGSSKKSANSEDNQIRKSYSAPNSPTGWEQKAAASNANGQSSEVPATKAASGDVNIEDLYAKVDKSRKRTPPAGTSQQKSDSSNDQMELEEDSEAAPGLAGDLVVSEGPYATSTTSSGPDDSDLQVDGSSINGDEGLSNGTAADSTSDQTATDKVATDLDFENVAKHLTPDLLRSLYRQLGLDKPTVERAEADSSSGLTIEKAISVLQAWRSIEGKKATQKAIIEALRRGQHNESADALVDVFHVEGSKIDDMRETCI